MSTYSDDVTKTDKKSENLDDKTTNKNQTDSKHNNNKNWEIEAFDNSNNVNLTTS